MELEEYKLDKDLVKYIENNVFPIYSKNEEGHGLNHIKTVIKRSLKLGKKYGANLNMSYVIAAYHDLGHHIDKDKHEVISAKMFEEDENIKKWFDTNEQKIIKEAIEDHRASCAHMPRSIYGKIVSSADRTIIDIDDIIKRSYAYGKRNYANLNEEEQIERIYNHLVNKYGEGGYVKMYLEDEEFEEALNNLRLSLSNMEEFIKRAKKVIYG